MFKVINNIIKSPMEPSYRKIAKSKSVVQQKILAYPNAVAFMQIAGFSFDTDHMECSNYNSDVLNECNEAISSFIQQLGGSVKSQVKFNPY